ncbi:MAG: DoxX family membrane protein [Deltaproteobacteria bacterium]|nr:DoxX family membrane protein [Deltaproteobacteria bacterium]
MSDHGLSWKKIICKRPFQFLLAVARIGLGAMFLYAGIAKIADPAGFSQAVYNYHLLPPWFVNIAAIVLPWVEVVAGTCLVLGLWIPGGALIVSALLLVFTLALGFNLSRGLDIACGCFGTSQAAGKITWWYLLRDSSLLVTGLLVMFRDKGYLSLDKRLHVCKKRKV